MLKNQIFTLLIVAAVVCGQEWEDTVTEGLLHAQADLAVGHEFFEMNIIMSRDDLSAFIYGDIMQLLDAHMDAHDAMKLIMNDTTDALEGIESSPQTESCLAAVRNRWQIQIHRAGQSLSRCIAVSNRRFTAWDRFLNNIHSTGHLTSNQVQNQGMAVLAEVESYISQWEIPRLINRRFRVVLGETLPYLNRFSDFLQVIAEQGQEAIQILIQCDREVAEAFATDAAQDLERARSCL